MSDVAFSTAKSTPFRVPSLAGFSPFDKVGRTVTPVALIAACAMGASVIASVACGQVSFGGAPSIPPSLLCVALAFDVAARLMPESRIATKVCDCAYAVLFLTFASLCGILFAYITQRLGMPLQDALFVKVDRAMGIDWYGFVRWVDVHPVVAQAFRASYSTMSGQIVLAAVVLALASDKKGLRAYLLAFTLAIMTTALVSSVLPALSPIAVLDKASYHGVHFGGATPIHHLLALRSSGTAFINGDMGGIISFPSFHATIGVLTPLALRKSRIVLAILVPVDAMLLCGAVTEGAHYASDVLAGGLIAVVALAVATRIVGRG